MPRPEPIKLAITAALTVVTGALALLTLLVPDWIEAVFGADPDGGDGSLEMIIVLLLAAACLAPAIRTGLIWRQQRRATS